METYVAIGIDKQTDKVIAIGADARAQSTYVIGKSGTGKSNLLETIASQDMQNGDGLCFLDPHGDSAKRLLASVPSHREHQVVFWNPRDIDHPFGLNPFYCRDPNNELEVSLKAQSFIDSLGSLKEFAEIFKSAPLMKDMLQQLATTFTVNQGHTLAETIQFLIDPQYRQQFYPALSGTYARFRRFWEIEFDLLSAHDQRGEYASSINKLRRFQSDPILYGIFGQPTNSIDFRKAMDERQIIIVDLSTDTQGIIGAFVVWEILQAARSRGDISQSERRPFHLFSDEFQTYLTTAFPKLQAEARKYGVDTVVAHQVREQLDGELPELTRAVGNLVIFQVTYPNAMALAGEFDTTPPPGETKLELVTEPVYESYAESTWTSKDAEIEHRRLGHELKPLYTQVAVLCYFCGLEKFDALAKGTDLNASALYAIYEKFNPCYFCITQKTNEGRSLGDIEFWGSAGEYTLPDSHPSAIEANIEMLLSEQRTFWSEEVMNHWIAPTGVPKPDATEVKAAAAALRDEVRTILGPIKAQWNPCVFISGYFWNTKPYDLVYSDHGGWKTKPIPDVLPWIRSQAQALRMEIDLRREKRAELNSTFFKTETKKRYLYDKPVQVSKDSVSDSQVSVYRPVPQTRLRSDVVAEIANEIVQLPKYQARCKITQNQGSPTEHVILALRFPGVEDHDQARRIVEKSRTTFGRDRRSVVRAVERRLQIRREKVDDEEAPIIREKADAQNNRKRRTKSTTRNGIQRRSF